MPLPSHSQGPRSRIGNLVMRYVCEFQFQRCRRTLGKQPACASRSYRIAFRMNRNIGLQIADKIAAVARAKALFDCR